MQQVNPFLTDSTARSIEHLVAASLMMVTRSGHLANLIALTQVGDEACALRWLMSDCEMWEEFIFLITSS